MPHLRSIGPAVPHDLHSFPSAQSARDRVVQLHRLPCDRQQQQHHSVQRKPKFVVDWSLGVGWTAEQWRARGHCAAAALAEVARLAVQHGCGVGAVRATCAA